MAQAQVYVNYSATITSPNLAISRPDFNSRMGRSRTLPFLAPTPPRWGRLCPLAPMWVLALATSSSRRIHCTVVSSPLIKGATITGSTLTKPHNNSRRLRLGPTERQIPESRAAVGYGRNLRMGGSPVHHTHQFLLSR